MTTEVWFRNPHDYIQELVDVGYLNIAWDRGLLVKRGIDPTQHAAIYCAGHKYRILAVGTQGTAEYHPGDPFDRPRAVYPTWAYGEDSLILEQMINFPIGEDDEACSDLSVRDDERPIAGQEHRVVITDMPDVKTGSGRAFLRYLKVLQEDNPKCMFHIHGMYSYRAAFGLNFGAADVSPRDVAQKGRVHLPNGSIVKWEQVLRTPQWAAVLGFKVIDLDNPKNRCKFNIKSALWAGEHYTEQFKFKTKAPREVPVDYTSTDEKFVPLETKVPVAATKSAKPGDKQLCDMCSLSDKCKYFREGAVCTVPGAEPVRLADMFKTRDADSIIDGLSMIAGASAARLERTMQIEEELGDVDPEVNKMMSQVFEQGVKLAKLLDPKRFSPSAKVAINVGGEGASISGANPREFVKVVIRQLEQQGFRREEITQEMIQGALEGMINPEQKTRAIQGTVVPERTEE